MVLSVFCLRSAGEGGRIIFFEAFSVPCPILSRYNRSFTPREGYGRGDETLR